MNKHTPCSFSLMFSLKTWVAGDELIDQLGIKPESHQWQRCILPLTTDGSGVSSISLSFKHPAIGLKGYSVVADF